MVCPRGKHTFETVNDTGLLDQIMVEVDNLNKSIQEFCPEIISISQYPSIQQHSDEMSHLIERRIELLTESSETNKSEKA